MPKEGKLPRVPEIEKEVLAAIRKLGGEATYRAINDEVRERLKSRVYIGETDKKTKSFFGTKLGDKAARARTSLRKKERIERGSRRGYWTLRKKLSQAKAKTTSGRVTEFAHRVINRMRELNVSYDAINAIRELLQQFQEHAEAHPGRDTKDLIVEQKAIDYILEEEPEWCRTKPNNPGFDLYRIKSDTGEKEWCEVKSLSEQVRPSSHESTTV